MPAKRTTGALVAHRAYVEPLQAESRTGVTGDDELTNDGRGWCGVRTYITGPRAIESGKSGHFLSNCHVDADLGCHTPRIDEVTWTIGEVAAANEALIHVQQQDTNGCVVTVESGVPSGSTFTLHAVPRAHAHGQAKNARIACQLNKADSQVITIS
jgi:hypothetical protein